MKLICIMIGVYAAPSLIRVWFWRTKCRRGISRSKDVGAFKLHDSEGLLVETGGTYVGIYRTGE